MKKLYHIVLRSLVVLTAAIVALDSFVGPFRHVLAQRELDQPMGDWLLWSPLILGALLAVEWAAFRKDALQRKALSVDLGTWLAWCTVYVVLTIQGLAHFSFL
jgi:hypothetical protein